MEWLYQNIFESHLICCSKNKKSYELGVKFFKFLVNNPLRVVGPNYTFKNIHKQNLITHSSVSPTIQINHMFFKMKITSPLDNGTELNIHNYQSKIHPFRNLQSLWMEKYFIELLIKKLRSIKMLKFILATNKMKIVMSQQYQREKSAISWSKKMYQVCNDSV